MTRENSGPSSDPIRPRPIEIGMSASHLVETAFLGSTAGRLSDAARLLTGRVLSRPEAILGLTLDATLVPAGLAVSSLSPLLQGGYVDWMAVSGINLYYDALAALQKPFHRSLPPEEDAQECGGEILVRLQDVSEAEVALREILSAPEFQNPMGSAELHHHIGAHLRTREKNLGAEFPSLLSTAHELGVPIYNPSPVDNRLGSLTAELALMGNRLSVDPSTDLNEAAAVLNKALRSGIPCAVWCLGRGAAANFMLEAPRHLQTIFGAEQIPSYDISIRMAGRAHAVPASPPEAPPAGDLPLSTDLSVALPLLTAQILDRVPPRPLKRLFDHRDDLLDGLRRDRFDATIRKTPAGS